MHFKRINTKYTKFYFYCLKLFLIFVFSFLMFFIRFFVYSCFGDKCHFLLFEFYFQFYQKNDLN